MRARAKPKEKPKPQPLPKHSIQPTKSKQEESLLDLLLEDVGWLTDFPDCCEKMARLKARSTRAERENNITALLVVQELMEKRHH